MHPVVVFREGPYFRTTVRVWLIAPCDGNCLANELLRRKRGSVGEPKAKELVVMPSFNEFLGGQAINRRHGEGEGLIGPVLQTACVDMVRASVYMLDGTYLGTVGQLRLAGI